MSHLARMQTCYQTCYLYLWKAYLSNFIDLGQFLQALLKLRLPMPLPSMTNPQQFQSEKGINIGFHVIKTFFPLGFRKFWTTGK